MTLDRVRLPSSDIGLTMVVQQMNKILGDIESGTNSSALFNVDDILVGSDGNVMTGSDNNVMMK